MPPLTAKVPPVVQEGPGAGATTRETCPSLMLIGLAPLETTTRTTLGAEVAAAARLPPRRRELVAGKVAGAQPAWTFLPGFALVCP